MLIGPRGSIGGGHNRRAPPRVIVLMGVSGCGKSTTGRRLAATLAWPFRDADSFHPPANIEKMQSGRPLDDTDRAPWLAAIAEWIDDRRRDGAGVVTCSALKARYRQVLIGDRPDVGLVYLKGSMGLIGDRLGRRKGHFMPPALLQSQFDALEEPSLQEHPLVVPVHLAPRRVVERILTGFGLAPARRRPP